MITPDPDASRELARELEPGEGILWSGRPRQGVVFRRSDIFVVPFTLMWAGFAFFWESQVLTKGAPLFMMIWGIPFMVIGVYITVGRFFWDARVRSQTFYAVTSTRVIIVAGGMRRSVRSLRLNILPEVSLHESSDASGSITFEAAIRRHDVRQRRVRAACLVLDGRRRPASR